MATDRRRQTMQPAADPYGNVRSAIPVFSTTTTTAKQLATPGMAQPNNRMSMSGPALRGAPYLAPSHVPQTNPRQSIMRSQNTNHLLMSTSRPTNNGGRTPLSNSARRTSTWQGPSGGLTAPSGSQGNAKDPRDLRDRQYQIDMKKNIFQWLKDTGFDIPRDRLNGLSAKEYKEVFNHLVSCVDEYSLSDGSKRFEEDFMRALQSLNYPFLHQIETKWLGMPASMACWYMLLGVLHWLTEMGRAKMKYQDSQHPTVALLDPEILPDEFDHEFHHQALALQHRASSYEAFLAGSDDFDVQDQLITERYERKDEAENAAAEKLNDEISRIVTMHNDASTSEAPLKTLQENSAVLQRDQKKFQTVIDKYDARKKALIEMIGASKADQARQERHLEELKAEKLRLENAVQEQNLSAEEVLQMKTDHDNLNRALEDLKHKITETHKTVMSLEVALTNKAAAAEEALDAYNALLATLGLFPPLQSPLPDVDLTLELNLAAPTSQQLLTGGDIRQVIRPTLSQVSELKRSERAALESQRIEVDNVLDKLTVECENVEDEVAEAERKVLTINEQADDIREIAQREAMGINAEASKLERETQQARTAALENGMGVKSRLQTLEFEYAEQVQKVDRLRDDAVRAIIKSSLDIQNFKLEVSRQLQLVREFAEQN